MAPHLLPSDDKARNKYRWKDQVDERKTNKIGRRECGFMGCDAKFTTNCDLVRHEKTHCEGGHQCSNCGKEFKQKSQLDTHKKSIHDKKPVFRCRKCDKTFTDQSSARRHEQNSNAKLGVGEEVHEYFRIGSTKPRIRSTRGSKSQDPALQQTTAAARHATKQRARRTAQHSMQPMQPAQQMQQPFPAFGSMDDVAAWNRSSQVPQQPELGSNPLPMQSQAVDDTNVDEVQPDVQMGPTPMQELPRPSDQEQAAFGICGSSYEPPTQSQAGHGTNTDGFQPDVQMGPTPMQEISQSDPFGFSSEPTLSWNRRMDAYNLATGYTNGSGFGAPTAFYDPGWHTDNSAGSAFPANLPESRTTVATQQNPSLGDGSGNNHFANLPSGDELLAGFDSIFDDTDNQFIAFGI